MRVLGFAPLLIGEGVDLRYRPCLNDDEYAGLLSSTVTPLQKARILERSGLRALRQAARREDGLLLVHRLRLLTPVPGLDPPRRLDAYDFDDALFLGSMAPANASFGWVKQEARRCVQCLRRARLVIAGNGFLADAARRHARGRVEVVPSCVLPEQQPLHQHEAKPVVTLGWIGSQTTVSYLTPLLEVLGRLNRQRLRARLVVVGGHLEASFPWLEQRPWSLAQEGRDLASFDVGLMPLPDTDWARGKCGFKLLQYFAAGVPAVASPIGVNRSLIGSARGRLASTPEDWISALEALVEDPQERAERGAAARRFVESHYSYARWAPELGGLLRALG